MCRAHLFLFLVLSTFVHASHILIVGAGTAGCVLAARLCVNLPNTNIILLERATPRSEQADFLVFSPRQAWNAWTSPLIQEIFPTRPGKGINNRSELAVTGNTLGGSSAVNGMQFVIPRIGSVESWRIRGLNGTSSRRYFKRAFRKLGVAAQVGNLRQRHVTAYLRAARKAGFAPNDDPFDASPARDMFENRLAVDKKGRRRDSYTAYLKPVKNGVCRRNLKVVEGATVTRIMLSARKRPRATGVEYVLTGTNRTRRIRIPKNGEIILSAGPYGSPKLLQLSGIGPKRVLRKAGIPVRVELPVGEKTQARPIVLITSNIPGVPLEPSNNSTLLESPKQRRGWEAGRGGVLGRAPFIANGRDGGDAYISGTGSYFPSSVDRKLISSSCFGNVKSRGFIRVRSKHPLEAPDVQYSFLSKNTDFRRIERCLNRVKVLHENLPKRFKASFSSPEDGVISEKWIRDNAGSTFHFVGGCQVGGVLSGRLKVKGVNGLRVVDASSIKNMPVSAGPMASAYMIAEFMADLLVEAHR